MTVGADALLDSNVLVSALAEDHEHHTASLALIDGSGVFAIAAHSYAEAYSTLTRRNAAFRHSPERAWEALKELSGITVSVGLSPAQTFDAIGAYARGGNIGPRLYDYLIGQAAVAHGIPRIVTWNVGHMRDLFPQLDVRNPADALNA